MATQEQFEKRRQRYERKQHHAYKARPRGPIGGYGDDGGGSHHGRPWIYVTHGKMKPLHLLVSYHPYGPARPHSPLDNVYVTQDGVHKTPHVHRVFPLPPLEWHRETAASNYFHRQRTAYGRKLGKLDGFGRRCWFAWRNAQQYKRVNGLGILYWPAWDPLNRTPVQP